MKGLRRLKNKFNNFNKIVSNTSLAQMGSIVISDIISHIQNQRSISGGTLKRNKPSTIKRKGSNKSLVDKGLLLNRNTYILLVSGNNVKVTLNGSRKEVARYLEEKGYHFWGISQSATRKIISRWNKEIRKWITK